MDFFKRNWKFTLIIIIAVTDLFIWYAYLKQIPDTTMTVAFLDVGQGDAMYIEAPNNSQIIVDGGPPRAILSELRKVMPFFDRTIDTLIVTNPDTDHYAGFIDVLRSYSVKRVIESGTVSSTETYKEFQRLIQEKNIERVIAQRGMIVDLGNGAHIEILFPDRDVSKTSSNDGSIIAELRYGATEVMLTGDAPIATEEYVASLEGIEIDSDVLKVGHHGSRTSASESFIKAVSPEYAVIPAGRDNKYGHPHEETVELFKKYNIPILGTYERGTIIMETDGETYWFK